MQEEKEDLTSNVEPAELSELQLVMVVFSPVLYFLQGFDCITFIEYGKEYSIKSIIKINSVVGYVG